MIAPVLAALAWLGLAGDAWACAVCPLGSAGVRKAYTLSYLLLSAVPLVYVGSLVWWARRKLR